MHPDPVAGAAAVPAGASANSRISRGGRIPFEVLAAIAIVGVAAAGHFVEAGLAAVAVVLGRWADARWRASSRTNPDAACMARALPAAPNGRASLGDRALSLFAAWHMPLAIALSAAVLMRTGDIAFALTLLLAASPQALLALPESSRIAWRLLAALAAAALLGGALAGFVGIVAAALIQQLSLLAARLAPE